MLYRLPSPFEDLAHTADAGTRACGADVSEALARSALSVSQLLAGGGKVDEVETHEIEAEARTEADLPVEFARAVLDRYYIDGLLLAAVEVLMLDLQAGRCSIRARGVFGPFDERHAEGLDIKAVTYSSAALERQPDGRVCATLIFDI